MRQQLAQFVEHRTAAIVRRFFPTLDLRGFLAGYPLTHMDVADLAFVLTHLHRFGVTEVAGWPIRQAIVQVLRQVDGPATETFFSYRVAESLLELGDWEKEFTTAEQANLRQAVDSTGRWDPVTKTMPGLANNYYSVLARCELGRQRLGLTEGEILDVAVGRVREFLSKNPAGFLDDSEACDGRFDIYTADALLFLWPLRDRLGPVYEQALRRHVAVLECIAMENGATWVYGRSIGALSVCLTLELGALAVQQGWASDRGLMLGLVGNAFEKLQDWFSDDLINAHRGPMTEGYRGIYRQLQMTLDCLGKVAFAAELLGEEAPRRVTFPNRDEWIAFDERKTGLWMFRNESLAFQLPVVAGVPQWDYEPWLHAPGLFESPVESALLCGGPAGVKKGSLGLPVAVEKVPAGLRLRYESKDFTRAVQFRVEGDTVVGEECWNFAEQPPRVGFTAPEARRPLWLGIETEHKFHQSIVATAGMAEWRSAWGELCRVHQVNFEPAKEIRFTWRLRRAVRVTTVPGDHDYVRALYDAMPAGQVAERPVLQLRCFTDMDVARLVGESEVLHIGWPEHLFVAHGVPEAELERRYLEFIAAVGRSGVKVVWTMHNRGPHAKPARPIYAAWAAIADGVIHHSRWGMEVMRRELRFKESARHVVIPHGHYGAQMVTPVSRAELETKYGVRPCAIRFGVLGGASPKKQVELIVRAFKRAARADQQLVISAHPIAEPVADDPRIVLLPKEYWLPRATVAEHVALCDALVSAHRGEQYLTSGTIADAVGAGIPMLVNEWEFFREMLGAAAFYHDNTEDGLTQLFATIVPADIERGKTAFRALQPKFAWPVLAAETLSLLRGGATR